MTKFAYAICADSIAHLAQYNKYNTFMVYIFTDIYSTVLRRYATNRRNAKIVPDSSWLL